MQDDERLIKIETMLVHQEQHIQDLTDALEIQRRDIAALTRQLERANARVAIMENSGADEGKGLSVTEQALRDKPPHY